jgi:transposase
MIELNSDTAVYLRLGSTDMRKSINGLSILVEEEMEHNPFSGDLFVFCNKRRMILKILYWERTGFAIWQKRLEKHRFSWPRSEEEFLHIGTEELRWLLAGLDFRKAHEALHYTTMV